MVSISYNTDQELDDMVPEVTNWGRWGENDQLGTLNYLTPEHTRQATQLVNSGEIISLARTNQIPNLEKNDEEKLREYIMRKTDSFCADFVGVRFHGFDITHLDGLCHIFTHKGEMYNGFSTSEIQDSGTKKLGIESIASKGIIGRGVLLDIARLKGKNLKPGDTIYLNDLLDAQKQQKVEIKSGDILFIRTGAGRNNTSELCSGPHPQCIPWIHENEISLLGGDGANDTYPNQFARWRMPIHMIGIPYLGLPLLDNAELDALSSTCQEENRWEFMITIAPWRFKGVTGSPVNPLAIF